MSSCGGEGALGLRTPSDHRPRLDLTFTDILSTAALEPFPLALSKDSKTILHGVSGEFKAGEMTAIMGPSGAGKSTLLNILAGYIKADFGGGIFINENERVLDQFLKYSCYIMQEDQLHPLLTVKEIMSIAAHLKLSTKHSRKELAARVQKIIDSIGLGPSCNTMTGSLSGGQKKRLTIALELLNNPPVMFFDEPTSGLDSSSSKQCITLLKELAREGRTIVCTLHQPSAMIFEMFDHLYCLNNGYCCYNGSPLQVTKFLSRHSLECPPYHNPADFLLEVCAGEYGDHYKNLVKSMENGKSVSWRKAASSVEDQFPSSHLTNENVTPVHIPLLPPTFMEEMKESDHIYKKYQLSIISQIPILVKRNFITLRRDQFLMHCRLLMHVMIGFIIGGFYRNVGNEASLVFDNFSLLFFTLIFIAFAAQSSMVVSFPAEVPIIRRESFNGWYSVKAYYIAHTLTDIPVQLASAILYCLIVYLMSNQPRDWHRFALFLSVCITTSLLSQSMGYLVGTLLKVQNGVIFGPLSMMPWVILSGYFLHMRDAPIFLQWTFKVSYLRYALEGLMLSIYSYDRPHLPCSEDYCHFISPTRFLQELDMGTSEFSTNMSFILTMLISFKVLSYYALVYQLKHKR